MHDCNPNHGSAGFTLVEVLVSLVLLAGGLLALAQLTLFSVGTSTGAYQHTAAHLQAQDMVERMWLDLRNPTSQVSAWELAHSASLPNWSGSVEQPDADDARLFAVRVQWHSPTGGAEMEHQYLVRLPEVAP